MKLQHILWIMNLAAFSLCPSTAAYLGVRPRIRRILDEMDVVGTFSKPDVHHYSVLKMSKRGDVLYVGARDAILALNPRNVTEELHTQVDWSPPLEQKNQCSLKGRNATTECFNFIRVLEEVNDTCLLVCGTNAFQPMCAYIERKGFSLVQTESNEVQNFSGRGMSPYNPADSSTATFAGDKLYSGTSNDFLGGEHVIQRTNGTRKDIDSEHQKSWLNEPRFVASEFVPEDADSPEDDKIYYFFTEIVSEFDFTSKVTVSRIARVCKGDEGGQRLLIRKWTSFLKAQLECSLQSKDLYFNQLIQDVFTLHQNLSGGTTETTFYATFISQMGELNISTVCKYDLTSVREVFLGKFKEERNAKHKWSTGTHSIPKPRPGQCLKDQRSQSLPDQTLKFVRDHSLMNAVVQPSGKAPLLVSDDARYTHLAVERLTSLSGRQLDVLYLATDRGFLHKAINVDGKMYLFEELRLFEGNQPVQNLLLHPRESMLYVASASQVLQLRTANCATSKTCADCLLARDPHCAWDTLSGQCRHVGKATDSKKWKQDVENANVAELCPPHVAQEPKDVKEKIIQKGVDLYMPCSLQSHLASIVWERDDKPIPNNDKHYEVFHNKKELTTALVIKSPEPKHNGTYVCWAEEGQSRQQIEVYAVSLPRVPPTTTPQATTTTMSTTIRTTNTIISTATAHVATTATNHQVHSSLDEMQNPVIDIPTTALPAATAAPCSACPCCSRPVLSASSPKPSAVPRISRPKNVRPVPLQLLPPLLVEQNQTLCDSHQVLLVCRAAGPPGVRITWTKAGDTLSRAQYSTDAVLVEGGRHQEVLSWLFVSVHHDTVFGCSAHWGTDVRSSYTKLHVAAPSTSAGDTQERPSPVELVQWKTVAHNHAYMMDLWHKAWTDTCHGNDED